MTACAKVDQAVNIELCEATGAEGFPKPHLSIDPVTGRTSTFDVVMESPKCGDGKFVCLEGLFPFVEPSEHLDLNVDGIGEIGTLSVQYIRNDGSFDLMEISRKKDGNLERYLYNFDESGNVYSLQIITEGRDRSSSFYIMC